METFDTDVVVVGSGGGGMTAALVAHDAGLKTLLVEKLPYYGGSTARSGGGFWAPANYLMHAAGVDDTLAEARTYLQATVGDRSPQAFRDTYLYNVNPMVEWLRDRAGVEFHYAIGYSDYFPERAGGKARGRCLEGAVFDGRRLGADLAQLNPGYVKAPAGIVIAASEFSRFGMVMRTWEGKRVAMSVIWRAFVDNLTGRKSLVMGQSLIGWLRLAMKQRDIPLWLETPLQDLIVDESGGRVTGIRVLRDGKPLIINARKGVILAAGCFAHNDEMRQKYQKHPITAKWTVASAGNTGDAILAGMRIGAPVDLMEEAWWGPSSMPPGREPYFHVGERAYPGLIMVSRKGRRFTNESDGYVDVVQAMYRKHTDDDPHVPAWFIFDQRYRNNYIFGDIFPRAPIPRKYLDSGFIQVANSIEELAQKLGMEPQVLKETVERFNGFARGGKDLDFGRGDSAYNRYFGDPTNLPNPNLAPLEHGPFYAVEAVAGDLGTKGGLVTDEFARVRRGDGGVFEGLYCIGNNSASVMGTTYPGPGCTIGPTMTFGYVAARHLSGQAVNTTAPR